MRTCQYQGLWLVMQVKPEGHAAEAHEAFWASAGDGAFVMPPHCAYGCSVVTARTTCNRISTAAHLTSKCAWECRSRSCTFLRTHQVSS